MKKNNEFHKNDKKTKEETDRFREVFPSGICFVFAIW